MAPPSAWWRPKGPAKTGMWQNCLAGAKSHQRSFRWCDHVFVQDSHVRVELSEAQVGDADLEPILAYVDSVVSDMAWWTDSEHSTEYALTLDLSNNLGISDYGVAVHLVPFLRKWPACRRLKLYRTSIGDAALKALGPWIAEGHARELHLSDLGGTVTQPVVLDLLRAIHAKGRYPYSSGSSGGQGSLWLRLEHNGIENVEELLTECQNEGLSLRIVDKSDLNSVRPGHTMDKTGHKEQQCPAIDLVLFRLQQRKVLVPDSRVVERNELLTLLRCSSTAPAQETGVPRSDPQPLSVDEFQLWTMEAREDAEGGANERNKDTFGDDATTSGWSGWSFEENLAANERLADQGLGFPEWLGEDGLSLTSSPSPAPTEDPATPEPKDSHRCFDLDETPEPTSGEAIQAPCGLTDSLADILGGFDADKKKADERSVCSTEDGGRVRTTSGSTTVSDEGPPQAVNFDPGPFYQACQPSHHRHSSKWGVHVSSTGNGSGRQKPDAKQEIESEVAELIQKLAGVLNRGDFGGQVMQWLHAIRTVGGPGRVHEALLEIHAAVSGKNRDSVQRWPAYLACLLKRFHRGYAERKGGVEPEPASKPRPMPCAASAAPWLSTSALLPGIAQLMGNALISAWHLGVKTCSYKMHYMWRACAVIFRLIQLCEGFHEGCAVFVAAHTIEGVSGTVSLLGKSSFGAGSESENCLILEGGVPSRGVLNAGQQDKLCFSIKLLDALSDISLSVTPLSECAPMVEAEKPDGVSWKLPSDERLGYVSRVIRAKEHQFKAGDRVYFKVSQTWHLGTATMPATCQFDIRAQLIMGSSPEQFGRGGEGGMTALLMDGPVFIRGSHAKYFSFLSRIERKEDAAKRSDLE
ncbi:unnamed protein product, partial [Polarella glacialis]